VTPRPFVAEPVEHLVRRLARLRLEDREVIGVEVELDVAAVGDLAGDLERFAIIGKEIEHLLPRAEVELEVVHAKALLVADRAAGADADQDVLRLAVLRLDVVDVLRDREADAGLFGDLAHLGRDAALRFVAVVHDLQVEVVLPEDLLVHLGRLNGAGDVIAHQVAVDLAAQAAAQRDQALAVLGQDLLVHARLVVEALLVSDGGELHEVLPTLLIASDDRQVVGSVVLFVGLLEARLLSDVGLDAEQRFDAFLLARLVEGDRAKEVAVVRQRDGFLAVLGGALGEVFDPAGAVEQAVVAVDVQMDEVRCAGAHRSIPPQVDGDSR
jgi:hypothetical protein